MKSTVLAVLAALVLLPVLAGCGGSKSSSGSSAPATDYTVVPTTTVINGQTVTLSKAADGLEFYDTVVGTGASVTTGQTITINYLGFYVNNAVFDISHNSSTSPLTYTLGTNAFVPGFNEGVLGMKVGGTRRIVIPGNLAYGATPPAGVPTNATLIYDVTLVSAGSIVDLTSVPTTTVFGGQVLPLTVASDGLEYYDLIVGTGATLTAGQSVTIAYKGSLLNGTVFDSNTSDTFPIDTGAVIPGLDQGIFGMKIGGTRRLVIPASLAYGSSAHGNIIPANATLVYDVTLLSAN